MRRGNKVWAKRKLINVFDVASIIIMKLPSDTLYLPIKQVYFDQIINGTKKEEFREILGED